MNLGMRKSRDALRSWRMGLILAVCGAGAGMAAEDGAKIEISGLGFLGNREMRISLERLLGEERGAVLGSNAIEDAMFLLMSAVQDEGFLKPVIEAELTGQDGRQVELTMDADMTTTVPRDVAARAAHFKIRRGTRYYVEEVEIEGLSALPRETAEGFFVGESTLLTGKAARAYTPARLNGGIESLETELRQRGYGDAAVRARSVKIDDATGKVGLTIEVDEGLPWRVAEVNVAVAEETAVDTGGVQRFAGQAWSESVQPDIAAEVRRSFFAAGYPDVHVRVTRAVGEANGDWKEVTLNVRVRPGEKVAVGDIRFEGANDVRDSVLRRRVRLVEGEPLNVIALEQARHRIARLGVFDRVDVRQEPAEGPVRDAVYALEPGRRIEVNLLAGYGTYEQLRGGVEVRQHNVFGLAHQTRGLLVESMKSSRGEYTYTVPEIFGESIDGTAKLFGLRREEVAFERQEWGGMVYFSAPISRLGVNATAGYTFQALRNRDNQLVTQPLDERQVIVASVDVGLMRDRRDNPLMPRRGYRVYGRVEAASTAFGGEAEYQRPEFGLSYHTAWGNGRWVHVSAAHGVVLTLGETDDSLPVNRRFYPGGDGSIRGYREGQASPRAADGRFIGAKSYVSATIELEQALTRKWSAVVFVDALGAAVRLADYPFDETLYSVGVGLRYQTLIGPIRVEYGRNIDPRDGDPSGTLLLSIGFPF